MKRTLRKRRIEREEARRKGIGRRGERDEMWVAALARVSRPKLVYGSSGKVIPFILLLNNKANVMCKLKHCFLVLQLKLRDFYFILQIFFNSFFVKACTFIVNFSHFLFELMIASISNAFLSFAHPYFNYAAFYIQYIFIYFSLLFFYFFIYFFFFFYFNFFKNNLLFMLLLRTICLIE